ncbi:MAG: SGNH/GDSL hydrolase family protein [Cellulosilyticaceae bacterium]
MLYLFQGDSITDCNRSRLKPTDLGDGYVNLINHYLSTHLTQLNISCVNRGIYGNRTHNLCRRWERDCLELSPDLLSLLIGINDTLRRFDLHLMTTPEEFRTNYVYLLDSIKTKNPEVQLVLMSPFLLPVEAQQLGWTEDLNQKIQIVKELATTYGAIYIPLQEVFNQHITPEKPNIYWTDDGVHPNPEGHILIAKSWIKAVLEHHRSHLEGASYE